MTSFRPDHPGHVAACHGLRVIAEHMLGSPVALRFEADDFALVQDTTPIDPGPVIAAVRLGHVDPAPDAKPGDKVMPISIVSPMFQEPLRLDWWRQASMRSMKMWGGRQSSLGVTRKLLGAMAKLDGQDPFTFVVPLSGRLGMDPTAGHSAREIGYSPDRIGQLVLTLPVVELFAAIGLQQWQFKHVGYDCWEYEVAGSIYRFSMIKRGRSRALGWASRYVQSRWLEGGGS